MQKRILAFVFSEHISKSSADLYVCKGSRKRLCRPYAANAARGRIRATAAPPRSQQCIVLKQSDWLNRPTSCREMGSNGKRKQTHKLCFIAFNSVSLLVFLSICVYKGKDPVPFTSFVYLFTGGENSFPFLDF